jgi:beta-galactosidase
MSMQKLVFCLFMFAAVPGQAQQHISLNGIWQIAQGSALTVPVDFAGTVPVPGLVDLARPAFTEVGVRSPQREAFWYKRTFKMPAGPLPPIVRLKINKAMYGARVLINGLVVADRMESFVPLEVNIREALKPNGAENEIVVRVLANRSDVPLQVISGRDLERVKYIPGIFDDVTLLCSGTPFIQSVQAVPHINDSSVFFQVVLSNDKGKPTSSPVTFRIREKVSGRVVAEQTLASLAFEGYEEKTIGQRIALPNPNLWSDKTPFLYEAEIVTPGDTGTTVFGMREFHFDTVSHLAVLNNKTLPMLGTNVCFYRFLEDSLRGGLAWDTAWVRTMFRKFKAMNWNCLRFTIGPPPQCWFDIADEEGILIQNEYAVWLQPHSVFGPEADFVDWKQLAKEYAAWMQEHWNHPSVVIWDAQNETFNDQTTPAMEAVRHLDLSNRPWENGWEHSKRNTDAQESHPYLFFSPDCDLAYLQTVTRDKFLIGWEENDHHPYNNPQIINEFEWLWLDRNGQPTEGSKDQYARFLPHSTEAERRAFYAKIMAIDYEFWRAAKRRAAAIMEFSSLCYSRPQGPRNVTSDHWIDLKSLTWDPYFAAAVKTACSPVIAVLDFYRKDLVAGRTQAIPIVVLNDSDKNWQGKISLTLSRGDKQVWRMERQVSVDSFGRADLMLDVPMPAAEGDYTLASTCFGSAPNSRGVTVPVTGSRDVMAPVTSSREVTLRKAEKYGSALWQTATASSSNRDAEIRYLPQYAVDGNERSKWTSKPARDQPQWLEIAYDKPVSVSRVELHWGSGFPRQYELQYVDRNGHYATLHTAQNGMGATEIVRFPKTTLQKLRLYIPPQNLPDAQEKMTNIGIKKAMDEGFSVLELKTF